MGYALSLGTLGVLAGGVEEVRDNFRCDEAKAGCAPAFVFSVPGQVDFRSSLHHLTHCNKLRCRRLKVKVFRGMSHKLNWLMTEHSLLGCVHIQPELYGSKRVAMKRKDFSNVAHHLAKCHQETCAQLRRALLLKVRDEIRIAPKVNSAQISDKLD